jgi:subtilase family serine protease
MSWGFQEGLNVLAQDEATYDSYLTTPAGHQGVTFVASTGDYGTADPEYPAFSPNVVAVGGTSLLLNGDASYNSETGWGYYSSGMGTFIGSGGGISQFEPEPGFQTGVQSTGYRTTPDVSFVADPNTGAWIADTYNLGSDAPWEVVGGTSLAAPSWAGLIALVNQGRVEAGQTTLNSLTPQDAQQGLYSLSASDFHSITSGTNGGYTASAGYNLVTGLGTPVGDQLIPDLVAFQPSGQYTPTTPSGSGTAGGSAGSDTNALARTNAFAIFDAVVAGSYEMQAQSFQAAPVAPALRSTTFETMPAAGIQALSPSWVTAVNQLTLPGMGSSASFTSNAAIGYLSAGNAAAAAAGALPGQYLGILAAEGRLAVPSGLASQLGETFARGFATEGRPAGNPEDALFSALGRDLDIRPLVRDNSGQGDETGSSAPPFARGEDVELAGEGAALPGAAEGAAGGE